MNITENHIKKLEQEKIILRKGAIYYIMNNEGKDIMIGRSKQSVIDFLKNNSEYLKPNLSASENAPENLVEESELAKETLATKDNSLTTAQPKELTTKSPFDLLENHLGEIRDLSSFADVAEDTIFILLNGKWLDSKDESQEAVRNLNIKFVWRKKERNVQDSQGLRNIDYIVFDKSIGEMKNCVKVLRDDTPNLNMITQGEMVVCVTKKSYYIEKKERKLLQHKQAEQARDRQRKEKMNSFGTVKNIDQIDKVEQILKADAEIANKKQIDYKIEMQGKSKQVATQEIEDIKQQINQLSAEGF